MTVYFHETKNQAGTMTNTLLKHLLSKNKINITDIPENSDAIFVSITDITYFKNLHQANKLFKNKKPIVVGGDVSKLPFIKNYADYVVLGEAYNFINELGKKKKIQDIEEIGNVQTKYKQGKIDYEVKYLENPIIKASNKVYYYYGSKGCPQKCKFCFYSHMNDYSVIDESKVIDALKSIPKSGKLYVTSAYFPFPKLQDNLLKKLGMIDLKIGMYNKRHYPGRSFRIGVEFFNEKTRKAFGKPILDRQITELINNSLNRNHEITTYFMGGIEDENEIQNFVDIVPEYFRTYSPRIHLHTQYIDFNEGTPLADVDVRERKDFNQDMLKKELDKKNRRFRVAKIKYKAHSTYRTLIQRTKNKAETEFIYSMRNLKDNDRFIDNVGQRFPHLLGSRKLSEVVNYG